MPARIAPGRVRIVVSERVTGVVVRAGHGAQSASSTPAAGLPRLWQVRARNDARRARDARQGRRRRAGQALLHSRLVFSGRWRGGGGERRRCCSAGGSRGDGGHADAPPSLFGIYRNTHADPRDHVAFFVCRDFEQVAPLRLPNHEIIACSTFPVDGLPPGLSPGTAARIREVLDGMPPAADW